MFARSAGFQPVLMSSASRYAHVNMPSWIGAASLGERAERLAATDSNLCLARGELDAGVAGVSHRVDEVLPRRHDRAQLGVVVDLAREIWGST